MRATGAGAPEGGRAPRCPDRLLLSNGTARRPAQTWRTSVSLTGGNWEGTGVEPDVPCAEEDAVNTAHRLAVRAVLDRHAPDSATLPSSVREEAEAVLAE